MLEIGQNEKKTFGKYPIVWAAYMERQREEGNYKDVKEHEMLKHQ